MSRFKPAGSEAGATNDHVKSSAAPEGVSALTKVKLSPKPSANNAEVTAALTRETAGRSVLEKTSTVRSSVTES